MRSLDEQMAIIEEKAGARKVRREAQKAVAHYGAGVGVCLTLIAGFFVTLPQLQKGMIEQNKSSYGSYIMQNAFVGYVIIGILAFALGICVTLLCLRLRAIHDGERGKR